MGAAIYSTFHLLDRWHDIDSLVEPAIIYKAGVRNCKVTSCAPLQLQNTDMLNYLAPLAINSWSVGLESKDKVQGEIKKRLVADLGTHVSP